MEFDLRRFHEGDEALFAHLVGTHSPRLLPYLRRYAGVESDVHDLLQEVWLRAFSRRRTFDGRGSLFGWLLMVGRTVGMAAARTRMRHPSGAGQCDVVIQAEADTALLLDSVREAVLSLPERQREVVLLRLIEGRSTADTARLLGCAEGTVKATLHQATRKLRELLKESVNE